jgi:hypothetical protein
VSANVWLRLCGPAIGSLADSAIAPLVDRVVDGRVLSKECDRAVAADRTMPLPLSESLFSYR